MRLLLVTIAALGLVLSGCNKDGDGEKGGAPAAEKKAEKKAEEKAEEKAEPAAEKKAEPAAEEKAAAPKVMTVAAFDKDYRSLKGMELMEKYSDGVTVKGKVKRVGKEMDDSMFLWLDVDGTKWVSVKFADKGAAAREKGVEKDGDVQVSCKVGGAADKYIMLIDCKLQ